MPSSAGQCVWYKSMRSTSSRRSDASSSRRMLRGSPTRRGGAARRRGKGFRVLSRACHLSSLSPSQGRLLQASVDHVREAAELRRVDGLERLHLEGAQLEPLVPQPRQHRVWVLLKRLPQLLVRDELADQDLHTLVRHPSDLRGTSADPLPHCVSATLFAAAGNLSTIASTAFLRSCSYCCSLSETAVTPWPRHNKSLVLGSNTSTITVPSVY